MPLEMRGRLHTTLRRRGSSVATPLLFVVLALVMVLSWLAGRNGVLGDTIQHALAGGTLANPMDTRVAVTPPILELPSPLPLFPPLVASSTADPGFGGFWTTPGNFDASPSTPTPISTTPGVCGHELEKSFGPGEGLLIHKVGGGDSLNRYEILYRTSVEAIVGVNLPFPIPLRTDRFLVIPLGRIEVGELPVFEALQVSNRNTPIQTMAFKVSADLQAFEMYNGFDESCRDFIGWVVAPRERVTP